MIENKEKKFISAVVYVHNNEKHLQYFLENVNKALDTTFEKYEIICVNDYSDDQCIKIIKDFSKNVKNAVVSIINMSFYQGMELSMNAGIDLSIGDFVFEFDQVYIDYEIDTILKVYRHSLVGYDIVAASPDEFDRNTSKLFYLIFNHFSDTHYKLRTESFRVLSRRVINRVHSMSKTIPYRKAIYANCGLKMDTIVYHKKGTDNIFIDNNAGDKRKNIAIDSLILFTDVTYKTALGMTTFMMVISVCIAGYAIFIFLKDQPVAGWTTTMLFLAFGFFGIFGALSVVIKYLAILVDLVFKKRAYTTESIEKLTK